MGAPSVLTSLLPVFLIIICGYVFKKSSFPDDIFWPGAERLVYYFLFPALLFSSTAKASWELYSVVSMVWALLGSTFVICILLFALRRYLAKTNAAFTSVFQGSIRFNSYIGLAAAFALFGDAGLHLAAVYLALMIPVVNVLSVMVLAGYNNKKNGWFWIFTSVVKNPLIIACLAGMSTNLIGLQLPEVLEKLATILGRGSLPLGLLAVGASLQIATFREAGREVLYTCFLKLLLFPALVWGACVLFRVDIMSTAIAVLFTALPGSPVSYILAKQLGGDSRLMSSIVAVQTGISMITLPIFIALVTGP